MPKPLRDEINEMKKPKKGISFFGGCGCGCGWVALS